MELVSYRVNVSARCDDIHVMPHLDYSELRLTNKSAKENPDLNLELTYTEFILESLVQPLRANYVLGVDLRRYILFSMPAVPEKWAKKIPELTGH